MKTFWTEFREGLLTPSISGFASASFVCLALFFASVNLVGPWLAAPDWVRWFAATPNDDEAFIAAALTSLPDAPRDVPHVLLLGPSSMREGVTSGPDVAARLARGTGGEVRVVELMGDNQAIEQSGALAAELPADVPGIVVIGITLYGLGHDPAMAPLVARRPRFGVALPDLDAELALQGEPPRPPSGIPLLDDPGFYLRRLPYMPMNMLTGGTVRRRHRYRDQRPMRPEELPFYAPDATDWAGLQERLEVHGPGRIAVMGRVAERIRARGHVPVFVAGPRIRVPPDDPATVARYDALLQRARDEHGVEVWQLEEAELLPSDFVDVVHLRTAEGSERFTEALSARLVTRLPRRR